MHTPMIFRFNSRRTSLHHCASLCIICGPFLHALQRVNRHTDKRVDDGERRSKQNPTAKDLNRPAVPGCAWPQPLSAKKSFGCKSLQKQDKRAPSLAPAHNCFFPCLPQRVCKLLFDVLSASRPLSSTFYAFPFQILGASNSTASFLSKFTLLEPGCSLLINKLGPITLYENHLAIEPFIADCVPDINLYQLFVRC